MMDVPKIEVGLTATVTQPRTPTAGPSAALPMPPSPPSPSTATVHAQREGRELGASAFPTTATAAQTSGEPATPRTYEEAYVTHAAEDFATAGSDSQAGADTPGLRTEKKFRNIVTATTTSTASAVAPRAGFVIPTENYPVGIDATSMTARTSLSDSTIPSLLAATASATASATAAALAESTPSRTTAVTSVAVVRNGQCETGVARAATATSGLPAEIGGVGAVALDGNSTSATASSVARSGDGDVGVSSGTGVERGSGVDGVDDGVGSGRSASSNPSLSAWLREVIWIVCRSWRACSWRLFIWS